MSLSPELRERISSLVESNRVLLFMKGNPQAPQCGFSATLIGILNKLLPSYETVDILLDPELRSGIKDFSEWPTIPQLYVDGEFVGGCDIVTEMYANGELHGTLGVEIPDTPAPTLTITPEAAGVLREALKGQTDAGLHLSIDARFRSALSLGPRQDGEVSIEVDGIELRMDSETATRADGVTVHVNQTAQGPQLAISNPNAPSAVRAISVQELKERMDDGTGFELIDVRPADERALASLTGAQALDDPAGLNLESLPKDTMLVFHCHHGGRSQTVCERFAHEGFTNIFNLAGGIDAWSREIDPAVPVY